MLYCIPPKDHQEDALQQCLQAHPEVQFVSLVGIDIFGHDTDEKVPIHLMLDNYQEFLEKGVQTDGSSVLLPGIADISDARVDLVPDKDSYWFVDHNFDNIDEETGLPVGSLRIPAILVHNSKEGVGSRAILRKSMTYFKETLLKTLKEHPYVFKYLPFDSADDIEEILLTNATELEFYVKTPHEVADRVKLHTSQVMKEQYWKRTIGPVRTALEKTLTLLDRYGFEVEMGHKEVGGVKADVTSDGYDHIMEQLEIDWRYADPVLTADRDNLARYLIKDTFRHCGLDVTFLAKPVDGVAGSGKHTHFGVAAKLKDGRKVNLFTALNPDKDYISPLGYGALMGLLKNYEIINPLANATTDALRRLKPGYEAPVCAVTSMGKSVENYSRNRTILLGLIRDKHNPMATRFEMRSPNPKSNCYLVIAGGLMAMIDGIEASLKAEKTPEELCNSVSKEYGTEDFYLEKNRKYRAENNIFEDFSTEEREKLFGVSPATVYENIMAFDRYPEKTKILEKGDVMSARDIASYQQAVLQLWATELHDRIIPHAAADGVSKEITSAITAALENQEYEKASELLKSI